MAQNNHAKILQHSFQNDLFRLAVKNAFNHIIITDADGIIIYANSAVERITGYSVDEVIGKTPRLWGGQMPSSFYAKLWHRIKVEKKAYEGEFTNRRKNGTTYYAHGVISPVVNARKKLIGFIGTEEDITKQKELDRMKSEFVSITAHQLKTPLTGIRWNLELLTAMTKRNRRIQRTMGDLNESLEELIGLVDQLLNISRIESGRINFQPKRFDAAEILQRVMQEMEHACKKCHQKLTADLKPTILTTDPSFLREIAVNLLSNAQKYTPAHGKIHISLERVGSHVVLRVSDTGYGIPKKEQKLVFKKYFRAQNILQYASGTGLGLYFVQELVQFCKGTISFVSEENKGTTFTVTFPIKKPRSQKGEVSLSETRFSQRSVY